MIVFELTLVFLSLTGLFAVIEGLADAVKILKDKKIKHGESLFIRTITGVGSISLMGWYYDLPILTIISLIGLVTFFYWLVFELALNRSLGLPLLFVGKTSKLDRAIHNEYGRVAFKIFGIIFFFLITIESV